MEIPLTHQPLSVYLNDHLAGSSAALEILSHLRNFGGLGGWTDTIRQDVADDREQLEALMAKAKIAQSTARQAAAWMGGKLAELKTRLDDREQGALARLELLEALALGIDGKSALWIALRAAAGRLPALEGMDYSRLISRAAEQRAAVEGRRIEAALDAFAGGTRDTPAQ
jgi:hypothetical protein